MQRRLLAPLALTLLAGCGQQYWSNGVRPTPRGEPRVLLVGRAGAWVPVACMTARQMRGRARPIAALDSSESWSRVSAGSLGMTRV